MVDTQLSLVGPGHGYGGPATCQPACLLEHAGNATIRPGQLQELKRTVLLRQRCVPR
jgi:hypothetical protein